MDPIMAVVSGAVVGFVSIGFLPRYLKVRPKGYRQVLFLTFFVFFAGNFFYLMFLDTGSTLWEVLLRSVVIGVIPLVCALSYVRLFLNDEKEDERIKGSEK